MISRRASLLFGLTALACLSVLSPAPGARWHAPAETLPARLSDDAFWGMIAEFSEPGGSFRSDNFVSNETAFQEIVPELTKGSTARGAYVGVGPDQNFTYLVAVQPRVAFIIDIRRQNMLEHLLYKALVELSTDRAEFLSRLFSRNRPPGVGPGSTVEALFEAYGSAAPSADLFQRNLQAVKDQLVKHHRFAITGEDLQRLEYVYAAFYNGGPDLSYSFAGGWRGGWGRFPTYAQLMMETDRSGERRSYLASEENFRILRGLENNNVVVPIVGDFAGPKALRMVGQYLKANGATVIAFYTSNVEQYLFQQDDDWNRFYANVATLPIDGDSIFIRSIPGRGFGYRSARPGTRATTRICSIADLLSAVNEGRITTYSDVIRMSK